MGLIEISETQLAFGYLHSYLNVNRTRRFMLPSIRQEGGLVRFPYPGADIIINDNHLIQFKRPFFFITDGIKEFTSYEKPADINKPYYRFYIKNDSPTCQLYNLIRATQRGLSAEYISPLFSDEDTFFYLIGNDRLHLRAYAHIDIAQFDGMQGIIGRNNNHTILYNVATVERDFCYCFSTPKKLKANHDHQAKKDGRREFHAFEILELLLTLFFPKPQIKIESGNLLEQCRVLQRRLMIERDIIWHFTYTIIR